MSKRLTTSADIEDGKVEYDASTNSTIVYKLIPKGYEMIITTPQPNGTNKTQTKTFYDPVPVSADELAEGAKKTTKNKKTDDNTTVVVRKTPEGREEITTTINADGTTSVRTKIFYDAEEVEETTQTTTETREAGQKKLTNVAKKPVEKPQPTSRSIQKINTEEETSTAEFKIKSEKQTEEVRRVTQTTEISGKSTKTTKKGTTEQQNVLAIKDDDSSTAKKKKTKKSKVQEDVEEQVDEKTTVRKKKVAGGIEYIYTTLLEDGTKETSSKTVCEQVGIEMTEEEIEAYEQEKRNAEKLKKVKKTKTLPSESGTKKVIPSENPGDVTTLETIQIPGGTEYHYTVVRPDGTVKKSSKTIYDPVPVEGDESEEEIIEEYEEEIIEPGEPVTRTITTTKTLPPKARDDESDGKKKLGQDAPASREGKKDVKKSAKK